MPASPDRKWWLATTKDVIILGPVDLEKTNAEMAAGKHAGLVLLSATAMRP